MANIQKLAIEIINDPINKNYSTMTNQEVADSMNAKTRTKNRTSLSGDEMFTATDTTEFQWLTDTKRNQWLSFTSKSADPFAQANIDFVQYIFGAGSQTISNLSALRTYNISRAEELGLLGNSAHVAAAHVAQARI